MPERSDSIVQFQRVDPGSHIMGALVTSNRAENDSSDPWRASMEALRPEQDPTVGNGKTLFREGLTLHSEHVCDLRINYF